MSTGCDVRHIINSNINPLVSLEDYLIAEFPDPEDRRGFTDAELESVRHDMRVRQNPIPVDEFIHQIESMSFFDKAESEKLLGWMSRDFVSWVPLGRDSIDGTAYRVVLDVSRFSNVQPYSHRGRGQGYLLGTNCIALNVLGSPADSAAPTAKTASADEASPAPSPGFVFHQLGRLQFFVDDEMPAMVSELEEDSWQDTGYVVAARINDKDGHMDEIYVIFECLPDIHDGIWPPLENPEKVAGHRGIMPPSNIPFSYAFIGDKQREKL